MARPARWRPRRRPWPVLVRNGLSAVSVQGQADLAAVGQTVGVEPGAGDVERFILDELGFRQEDVLGDLGPGRTIVLVPATVTPALPGFEVHRRVQILDQDDRGHGLVEIGTVEHIGGRGSCRGCRTRGGCCRRSTRNLRPAKSSTFSRYRWHYLSYRFAADRP